jgi:hypothetical protein
LSHRPGWLHKLAESIPGLHKRLQIRAEYSPRRKKAKKADLNHLMALKTTKQHLEFSVVDPEPELFVLSDPG